MDESHILIEWLRQERAQLATITKELTALSRKRHTQTRRAFLALQIIIRERRVAMGQLALRDALLFGIPVC
jgi:hypothetical protein